MTGAMNASGLRRVLTVALTAAVMAPLAVFSQSAPSTNYTSVDAKPGAPTQIGYYGSAHKDCTPARIPGIRVLEAPKSGLLTIRKGTLSTQEIAGCPRLSVPAQVLFYQLRDAAATRDHLIYSVVSENGETGVYDVTITIKFATKASPTPDGKI